MGLHSSVPLIGEAYGEEESQVSSHLDGCPGQARQLRPRRIAGVSSESLHGSGGHPSISSCAFWPYRRCPPNPPRDRSSSGSIPTYSERKTSVSKATEAISDYKKAVDQPEGLTELMVFLREVATDFCDEFGMQDEGDFGALVRMFEQAAELANTLPPSSRDGFVARLNRVRLVSHNLGYGVGAEMDFLLSEDGEGEG
jgi:hypothetical protein